jgi:hypothetical protein
VIETTNGTITHIYKSSGTRTYKIDVTGFDGLKYFNATKSIVVFCVITKIWGDELMLMEHQIVQIGDMI